MAKIGRPERIPRAGSKKPKRDEYGILSYDLEWPGEEVRLDTFTLKKAVQTAEHRKMLPAIVLRQPGATWVLMNEEHLMKILEAAGETLKQREIRKALDGG